MMTLNPISHGIDLQSCRSHLDHCIGYLLSRSSTPNSKENTGNSPFQRQRRIFRFAACTILAFGMYNLYLSHFAGTFVPDIEIDKDTGDKKVRRRPDRMHKIVDGKKIDRTPHDGIIEGHLHLIDIHITNDGLSGSEYKVKGTFCLLDWTIQQDDPSRLPRFEDIIRGSSMCGPTRYTADLYELVQGARAFDDQLRNTTYVKQLKKKERTKHIRQPDPVPIERSIPPTLLVFHESRCGSTLVSNLLASFSTESSKVYSEAPAPLKALQACEFETSCNEDVQQKLIDDVFYMMGRTHRRNPEQYVFYKLQSKAVRYIQLLQDALPQPTPWMYVYRDNNDVMMSHFQGSVIDPKSDDPTIPECLENFGSQDQPEILKKLVEHQGLSVASLSKKEYCAAHLATLSENAIKRYETENADKSNNEKRFFVNYQQLPQVMWDYVLPSLGITHLKAQDIQRMEKVAAIYTHSRTSGAKSKKLSIFGGDTQQKEKDIPFDIAQAANTFMHATYEKLEEISKVTMHPP